MGVVSELIRSESDGTISFGDYTLGEKTKKSDFSFKGDIYKVKTFNEVTKLEKNELFIYESVPGTSVNNFDMQSDRVEFTVLGKEESNVSITLELSPETEYTVSLDGEPLGNMTTKSGGKLSFSLDIQDKPVKVLVAKA